MPRAADPASKIREIYLSLPDTKETPTWGSPHFRVGDKIFGGMGEEDGKFSIGFKLEMEHADALVSSDPRFARAKYVGHKGWVNMDVSAVHDWDEVKTLVGESYRLIAPKRSLAKLGAAPQATTSPRVSATPSKPAAKKAPAKKPPAKKAPAKKPPVKKGPAKKAPTKKNASNKNASAVTKSRAG